MHRIRHFPHLQWRKWPKIQMKNFRFKIRRRSFENEAQKWVWFSPNWKTVQVTKEDKDGESGKGVQNSVYGIAINLSFSNKWWSHLHMIWGVTRVNCHLVKSCAKIGPKRTRPTIQSTSSHTHTRTHARMQRTHIHRSQHHYPRTLPLYHKCLI